MKTADNSNNFDDATTSSSSTGSSRFLSGEIDFLLEAVDNNDEVVQLTKNQSIDSNNNNKGNGMDVAELFYGTKTPSEEQLRAYSEYGIIRKALIVPKTYYSKSGSSKKTKLMDGLNPKDFDISTCTTIDDIQGTTSFSIYKIKPRRASLPIMQIEFFDNLTRVTSSSSSSTYIWYNYDSCLNGWPSLRCFELVSLEERRTVVDSVMSNVMPKRLQLLASGAVGSDNSLLWKKVWDAAINNNSPPSSVIDPTLLYRATIRASPWTSYAWAKDNPGFVFWYEPHHQPNSRFTYGMELTKTLSQEHFCTHIHMFSHRYAVGRRETTRDRMTYHSVCVLEWNHGRYCSVIELAYLNGVGCHGKSNFYDDRNAKVSKLFAAFPPELIQPALFHRAEIRCYDVEARNIDEFKDYVSKYSKDDEHRRFVDPEFTFSHPARLSMRSKAQIARYLINYITRDTDYEQLKRNCQTFAADLCGFLAGKKNVSPYSPLVSTVQPKNKMHYFLYDSYAYDDNNGGENSSSNSNNNSISSQDSYDQNDDKANMNNKKQGFMKQLFQNNASKKKEIQKAYG